MTATHELDIDIQSHELYVDGPPYDRFDRLRAEAPVYRHVGRNDGEIGWFWALTRHADIITVSRQWQQYSSGRQGVIMMAERPDMELAHMMIDMDPPDHTRVRRLVERGFTPKAIKLLADHYVDVTRRLVGQALETGEIDFVSEIAAELPLIAIAEMLGVPDTDRHRIFEWANRMVASSDPDYSGGIEDASNAAQELYLYANELGADRRANPRDDIISILVSASDGDQLSDHEFDVFVLLLSVAGSETTRNAISHGLLAMIEHPEQWQRLRDDPELVTPTVEEILRWATPVNTFRRTAQSDVELHGQLVREGDPVVMFYASANRDERVFADPYRFDIGRTPNPHVTFGGGGPHFCLGASLARLEIRAVFAELAQRCAGFEQTGEVRRLRNSFVNGVKSLPVRLLPA
jgi:cholest-4-en-3-one 26-monooxygenase